MYGFSHLECGKCANATEDRVYNLFVQIIINFAPAFWQSWYVILGELFWWICAGLVVSFFYGLSNKAIVAPIVFDVNRSIYNCLTVYRKVPMLALNIFAI